MYGEKLRGKKLRGEKLRGLVLIAAEVHISVTHFAPRIINIGFACVRRSNDCEVDCTHSRPEILT